MSTKVKAGTYFLLPLKFITNNFDLIDSIEFIFTRTENGETVKSALWSRNGESRDAALVPDTQTVNVLFTTEDSYLFKQGDMFFIDTRIHYTGSQLNPYTPIKRLRMERTLFKEGEEVS